MLFVSSQGEGQYHSNSEAAAQQQAGDCPPADPSQRIITAHLMHCWKDHQYVLGHVALARSEKYLKVQSVQRIPAVPKDERVTISMNTFRRQTLSTPTLRQQILQRLLKSRRLGTLTGALFLGWLTCLLNDLSLASVWTCG